MYKKILIAEGNLEKENNNFTRSGIPTHTESLKESLSFFTNDLDINIINPSSEKNINTKIYGIWGMQSNRDPKSFINEFFKISVLKDNLLFVI